MVQFIYPSITSTGTESVVWNERLYNQIMGDLLQQEKEWDEKDFNKLAEPYSSIEYIYKYRTFNDKHPEWTSQLFSEQKMWSPSLKNLNDPLEMAFGGQVLDDPATVDAINMMMNSNWYGCICFSRDPVCVQMWAHYASSHSGYCVEYYRPDSFFLSTFCRPVKYRRTMPSLENSHEIDELFWTKSDAWEYEAEWRLRYIRSNAHTLPGLLKPSGVIFGLRTPDKVKKFIRSHAGNIRFGEIKPSPAPYRIQVQWE